MRLGRAGRTIAALALGTAVTLSACRDYQTDLDSIGTPSDEGGAAGTAAGVPKAGSGGGRSAGGMSGTGAYYGGQPGHETDSGAGISSGSGGCSGYQSPSATGGDSGSDTEASGGESSTTNSSCAAGNPACGTWNIRANGFPAELRLFDEGDAVSGEFVTELGTDAVSDVRLDEQSRWLEFRRAAVDGDQWYRVVIDSDVLVGRFSTASRTGRPERGTYFFHVTGWRTESFAALYPRSYDLVLNDDYLARLAIDRAGSGTIGRLKGYATASMGAADEHLEDELAVDSFDGENIAFMRWTEPGLQQSYTGVIKGEVVSGTFTQDEGSEVFEWHGKRAEVLSYGISGGKTPTQAQTYRELTRRRLRSLMMDGASNAEMVRVALRPVAAMPFSTMPPTRDDGVTQGEAPYTLEEFFATFRYRDRFTELPVDREVRGYLATPTGEPPADGFEAVIALNDHGGSSKQVLDPTNDHQWYGDAFARRGHLVIAIDVSHRPDAPPMVAPGMGATWNSDWEEEGERVGDAMRVMDYLETRSDVNRERVGILGLGLGGRVGMTAAALDERFAFVVASAAAGDLAVMSLAPEVHQCFRWNHAEIQEFVGTADLMALVAPRLLVVQTGAEDASLAGRDLPISSSKQLARRVRAAFNDTEAPARFVHNLHWGGARFHTGVIEDSNGTSGIGVPVLIEPADLSDYDWQRDPTITPRWANLFEAISTLLQ